MNEKKARLIQLPEQSKFYLRTIWIIFFPFKSNIEIMSEGVAKACTLPPEIYK